MPEDAEGSALQTAIAAQWGSLEAFQTAFSAKTVAVQG
jgi:superoxide dismutase